MARAPARRALGWAAVMVCGVVLGVGSAWLVLSGAVRTPAERVGAWTVDLEGGSEDAGLYERAVTSVQGLLALAREEAVYLVADEDDEGRRLEEDCSYRLTGGELPADWWSVTLYDGAYLPDNDGEHLSVDATSVDVAADGRWAAEVGPDGGGDWISTEGADRPNLVLRLYLPEASVLDDPTTIPVPRITRLGCGSER